MTTYVYEARVNDRHGQSVEFVYFLASERRDSDERHQISEIARFPHQRQAQAFLAGLSKPGKPQNRAMFRLPDGRMMQFDRQHGDLWLVSTLDSDNRVQRQMTTQIDNIDTFIAGLLAEAEGRGQYQGEIRQLLGEG